MKTKLKAALIGGGTFLAAAAIIAGTLSQTPDPASAETPRQAATVKTTLPGLTPASGEPDLPALRTLHPKQGQAIQAHGPFDDRFVLDRLTFTTAGATGTIRITSDVSDLLELQILAGFYDTQGKLVGTGRYDHHLEEDGHTHAGPPVETETFTIPVPKSLHGTAVSAAVGVPILVNE
jgi:hypothetical protein